MHNNPAGLTNPDSNWPPRKRIALGRLLKRGGRILTSQPPFQQWVAVNPLVTLPSLVSGLDTISRTANRAQCIESKREKAHRQKGRWASRFIQSGRRDLNPGP